MNYERHYKALTGRAPQLIFSRTRNAPSWEDRDGTYREAHRILPGCMGGKYIGTNVAYLTPAEHYVAHQLLVKMYPGNTSLLYAANMMTVESNLAPGRITNKKFGWLRKKYREMLSDKYTGQTIWKVNPMQNEGSRKKVGESKKGRKFYYSPATLDEVMVLPSEIPSGYVPGRSPRQADKLMADWEVTFPDGHVEVVSNLRQFCRDYGLHSSNLLQQKNGSKGYKVKKLG